MNMYCKTVLNVNHVELFIYTLAAVEGRELGPNATKILAKRCVWGIKQVGTMEDLTKRLLSVEETAHILGIAPRTIYNRVGPRSKNPFPIKPKRVGRLVKFRTEDVEKYIND